MKVELWYIGKTAFSYLEEGMKLYESRLGRYLPFQREAIPDIRNAKNLSPESLKAREGEAVLARLRDDDFLVLLDERGGQLSSIEWAKYLEKELMAPHRRLVFLIGGAYGFAPEIYKRAGFQVSLSRMTFSHQMVRLFFLEQLYRAMTILRNEPYHNEG